MTTGSLTRPRSGAPRERLRAIALMLTALVLFSCLDTAAKYLVQRHGLPVIEVVWLRFLGQVVYMVVIWQALRLPALVATSQPWPQLLRSALMLGTTAFNFLALGHLRLDQTITVVFLTPLTVTLLAGPLLGEWVGWRRMTAILTGFVGVVIAVWRGADSFDPAFLYSFGSMLCYAAFMLLTRAIAGRDQPFVTLFWSMIVGAIGMAPFALLHWVTPPSATSWLLLGALGAFGGAGHFLFIHAYRLAPASAIAPFLYFQLIAMVSLGYLVFGDVPDVRTATGLAVVVGSGLYLFARERKLGGP